MAEEYRISNDEVVRVLKEALAALEIKEKNIFRIRAYQNAIAAIDNLTTSVYDMWEDDRLEEIPGVGESLKEHLNELFTEGSVKDFENMKKSLPAGMFPLLDIRGIGAKTAYRLASTFELNDPETALSSVKELAEQNKIQELPGFGEKSEREILESIEDFKKSKSSKKRLLLVQAEEVADRVISYMKKLDCIEQIDPLGSLRRRMPTVGDVDISVSVDPSRNEDVMEHFISFPEIKEVVSKGDKFATVILTNDIQIDLLLSEPDSYGSMLQHFTGSKNHNILLRSYALESGLSLSQHGIKHAGITTKYADEKKFYRALSLDYIPPELREGTEEIGLAKDGKLPELVTLNDIRGDLHMHTVASDGVNTLEDMVGACKKLGYAYIGITDHSPGMQSRGRFAVLGVMEETIKRIEQINDSQDDIRVLFGYEVNILADATLSLPDEVLEKLDLVIAAVHTSLNQDRAQMTARIMSAIENPNVDIIGHPSGRLINEREASDLDWDQIFDTAKKYNKILEINSQPTRLDLPDDLVREAVKRKIKLVINSDSHDAEKLDLIRFGVDVARRGGCSKEDIINTLPLKEFMAQLPKKV